MSSLLLDLELLPDSWAFSNSELLCLEGGDFIAFFVVSQKLYFSGRLSYVDCRGEWKGSGVAIMNLSFSDNTVMYALHDAQ